MAGLWYFKIKEVSGLCQVIDVGILSKAIVMEVEEVKMNVRIWHQISQQQQFMTWLQDMAHPYSLCLTNKNILVYLCATGFIFEKTSTIPSS